MLILASWLPICTCSSLVTASTWTCTDEEGEWENELKCSVEEMDWACKRQNQKVI